MVDTFGTHYLFRKRDVFYFSRHVPVDVRAHYGFGRIVRSFRTKSHSRAVKTAIVWSEHLEQAWANIRLQHLGVLSLPPIVHQQNKYAGPKISDALGVSTGLGYCRIIGPGTSLATSWNGLMPGR